MFIVNLSHCVDKNLWFLFQYMCFLVHILAIIPEKKPKRIRILHNCLFSVIHLSFCPCMHRLKSDRGFLVNNCHRAREGAKVIDSVPSSWTIVTYTLKTFYKKRIILFLVILTDLVRRQICVVKLEYNSLLCMNLNTSPEGNCTSDTEFSSFSVTVQV